MPRSLRTRLLVLLVALVGAALLASTVAALRAANANVSALVQDELDVRERIASFALAQQGDALRQRVQVITADYGFRAAVATGDRPTVLSALANQGGRLDADLVMLLTPAGEITLSSVDIERLPAHLQPLLSTTAPQSSLRLEVLAEEPYKIVISPVLAPGLSGWLIIGEALNQEALDSLQQLTAAAITLRIDRPELAPMAVSTLGELPPAPAGLPLTQQLAGQGWVSREVRLSGVMPTADNLAIYVSLSLAEALADYNPLRAQLIVIAMIALALAAVLATVASRWITRPVSAMVQAAQRIADGDYTYRVDAHSGTELDTLGEALGFMQDTVAEREARIQHQAQHDLLTQLPNRNYLFSLYQRYVRENPQGQEFGLALLEIENLPKLRDLYGSEFSDEVLREVSRRTGASLRRGDMAGRVGDQQILLFLQGMGASGLSVALEKIGEQSREPLFVNGVPVQPELRLGFAFSPAHGRDFDDLQRRAQLAISDARSKGLGHAVYTLGQDENHLRQIRIATRLQEAIHEQAFHLLYQPKYDLHKRRVTSAEALLRWEDRELGPIYPDEFIPVAEQTGLITQLSQWVVAAAIDEQKRWRAGGMELAVSINLSGLDVLQTGFVDQLMVSVQKAGLPPTALVLEVTETAMMADVELARSNLARAEQMGMRVSIDDYGTGFSSLAQLRTLPVRELKLDRSLVENIDHEEGDHLIVKSTIDMAHHLGLEVVAEGVETLAILTVLAQMGCDVIQGYLLAKPMRATELTDFLKHAAQNTAMIEQTVEQHFSA